MFVVRDPNKKEKPHMRTVFLFNDMLVVSTSHFEVMRF